jgi:glutamine synthetase
MSQLRFKALEKLFDRKPIVVEAPGAKVSDYYGELVFSNDKMKKYLSKEAYKHIRECIVKGTKMDLRIADQIASGMKAWAIEQGCTHYTHWFQPLTEATAEKHDAFMDITPSGEAFESFGGGNLAQQEPDASSFPSGGIRATFEARGYTAWDPSSPAFIINNTLCIPTIFISFTGEALDYKMPLLKALHAVDKAAIDVINSYFDKDAKKITANLGWEQEYFLIDDALFNARPDLMLCDRTLMGHTSAKNQQLEDHYFASIPERVANFMKNVEYEAHKLGIPIKTRHNEVAPNQFEFAPIFEECNLACDHNLLLMDLMKRVARLHNFRVILHEKPFKGINGSGKHNNWSLCTDNGINCYSPGKTPRENLLFLTFVVNTLVALKDNQDLLRASILTVNNEHRLGANEAPPSIISAFLGTEVTAMLDEIESKVSDKVMSAKEKTELKLNIGKIPQVLLDNTDRNRTSPFAFTGNRFEFRAVGSSANSAAAMIALNSIVASQLIVFKAEVDALIKKGTKKDEAILKVLRKLITYAKPIIFNGNGYSEEWVVEASKRGLTNVKSTPEALKAFITPQTIKLFEGIKVLSKRELESRYEIKNEMYVKKLQIEARVLGDLAINHIIPTAIKYQTVLINNVTGLKSILGADFEKVAGDEIKMIKEIAAHTAAIRTKVAKFRIVRAKANEIEHADKRALEYSKTIKPYLDDIRSHIDELETIVDDELWPLPKYRELLFNR